jgi:hypothetical protein
MYRSSFVTCILITFKIMNILKLTETINYLGDHQPEKESLPVLSEVQSQLQVSN